MSRPASARIRRNAVAKKSAASKTTVKKTSSKAKTSKSSTPKTAAKSSKAPSKKSSASKPTPSEDGAVAAKTTRKPTSKKPSAKKSGSAAASTAKKQTSKAGTSKTATKKSTSKKTVKKPSGSKKTASKSTTLKKTATTASAAKKQGSTKSAKPVQSKSSKAKESPAAKSAAPSKSEGDKAAAQAESDSKNAGRKGITVVENRPRRKSPAKSKITPPTGTLGSLLAKRRRQPLIPSGPDAPPSRHGAFGQDEEGSSSRKKPKSPFKKRELDGFREQLLSKRRELVGDVTNMESGMASRGDRGGNPALDVAEQGSDAYDQSLSIGLAEADRKIIREIDDAIRRIEDGSFGLCEVTHEPIGVERLKQLPWARLSIEAAREIERRGGSR